MTGRLPAVKPKELIRALERTGWHVERVSGSHHILVNVELRRVITIPLHNRELKIGTLTGILRGAGVSRDDLRNLLE